MLNRSWLAALVLVVACADGGTTDAGTATSSTSGTGTGGSSGSTTDDSTTTSSSSSGGVSSSTDPTADPTTGSGPETTGSVMLCEQELNEPNDTEVIAEEISVGDCGFDRDGAVGETDPFDFFRLSFGNACLTSPATITIDSGPEFELCTIFRCTGGNTPDVVCGGGSTADPSGEQCCHNDDFTTEFTCPAGDPVVFLRTRSQNDECQPYIFRWDGMQ